MKNSLIGDATPGALYMPLESIGQIIVVSRIFPLNRTCFQSMLSNKLVLNVVGKNGGVDQVSLSSNGSDVATHLLSSGLVEFERQKNRNKYGTLVSNDKPFKSWCLLFCDYTD